MSVKKKIAIIISHPIQHFCPQYESWAKGHQYEMKVFFASALGYKSYYDPNFKKEISWDNIRLERFDHVFLNGGKVLPADTKLSAPSLSRELSDYCPDIIITYGYFQPFQRAAYQWAKKNKVKIAYISDSELRQQRSKWRQLLKYPYLKNYFGGVDFFLTVGDANEDFYRYYGVKDEKFIRMHFPIDINTYERSIRIREDLRRKIREGFGVPEHATVVSVVGKLVPWKNQDHIIEAMSMLEAQGIHIHLFMLGSGEMLDEWTRKAEALVYSKVHFTGFVSVNDLPAFYAASDMYVHPASKEPHSIAISEAIYMGCPVIVSDRCGSYGATDDVQEGTNGYIYQFGNIQRLAEKIAHLALNENLREEFSANSRKLSRSFQKISHSSVIKELIQQL